MTNEKKTGSFEKNVYVFPKWANRVPFFVLLGLLGLVASVIFVFSYWMTPKHFDVGYQPDQPIPYSHRLHVGELGIDCRYCHSMVDQAAHANIPSTETCLNCHNVIKKESPEIMKLRESYANNEPIEWKRVHFLPDYAFFNHSRHVNSGVSCVSCHGRVDQMEVVRQEESLSMSWCLDCHRNPDGHIRPKDQVTNLGWVPDGDPAELGKELREAYHVNPKESCTTCHY